MFSPTAPIPPTPPIAAEAPVKPYLKSSPGKLAPSLQGPGSSRHGVTVVRCLRDRLGLARSQELRAQPSQPPTPQPHIISLSPHGSQPAAGLGSGTSRPNAGASRSPSVYTQNSPVSSTVTGAHPRSSWCLFPTRPRGHRWGEAIFTATNLHGDSKGPRRGEQTVSEARRAAGAEPCLVPSRRRLTPAGSPATEIGTLEVRAAPGWLRGLCDY